MKRSSLDDLTMAWLIEEDNPCVRYLALGELLGKGRSKEARESRGRIPEFGPVKKMLAPQRANGGWDEGTCCYSPKYKSTVWQAAILSQTGIDPELPAMRRMCDYVERFISEGGGFRTDRALESDWGVEASCLNGNMIGALCRLGRAKDSTVAKSVDNLLSIQFEDGGWGCRTVKSHRSSKHGCFAGSICALEALIEYSNRAGSRKASSAIDRGCEFLLMHRLFRADHHDLKVIHADWLKLRSPYLFGYDILRGLRALSRAGFVEDSRSREAVRILISKRNPAGRWPREVHWWSNSYASFGGIRKEDKWVTLNAMIALKGFSEVL